MQDVLRSDGLGDELDVIITIVIIIIIIIRTRRSVVIIKITIVTITLAMNPKVRMAARLMDFLWALSVS